MAGRHEGADKEARDRTPGGVDESDPKAARTGPEDSLLHPPKSGGQPAAASEDAMASSKAKGITDKIDDSSGGAAGAGPAA